jgi:hypothetical protein
MRRSAIRQTVTRRVLRWTIFIAAFCLGTGMWYALAQRRAVVVRQGEGVQISPPVAAPPAVRQTEAAPDIESGPVPPISGYVNTKLLKLHLRADASSPVVATLKTNGYESLEILEATRDFLRVRLSAPYAGDENEELLQHEGWASWGAVMPHLSAFVLEAETGAVVGRVPLGFEGGAEIAYSPDGSRVVIYNSEYQGGAAAYELETKGYTFTRALTVEGGHSGAAFYGPSGDLYAGYWREAASPTQTGLFGFVAFGAGGANFVAEGISDTDASDFVTSPDGSTGFVVRPSTDAGRGQTVDVVDLKTLKLRHSFTLDGENPPGWGGNLAVGRDGSEIYFKDASDTGTIAVIETITGSRVRGHHFQLSGAEFLHFSQNHLVGERLLVRVWKEMDHDSELSKAFWIEGSDTFAASRQLNYAVEAQGTGYAVNEAGTLLYRLDAEGRVRDKMTIDRPDLRQKKGEADELSTFGLSASPDGRHLIVLIGMEHGC